MRHFMLSLFMLTPFFLWAQPTQPMPTYQTEWNKADSLAAEGLPKSALAIVDQIYARAKAARNYPQLAKAAMQRMAYRTFSDENDYAALIQSTKKDITDTPEPVRSVLQSVLAEIYWRYYQQNRNKFYQRTTVSRTPADLADKSSVPANPATDDPRTWDARRLFFEITAAYEASLKNTDLLQKTSLTAYDVILDRGDVETRPLRPTLFDVLAHRAISYFQNTEPDILKPVFRFDLDQPSYLAGPEAFAKLPLTTRDSLSGRFHALRIYQQLIAQHLLDADPRALADVDNLRLQFVYTYCVIPDKDSLYRRTLEQQIVRYKGKSPAEADYLYQLSRHLANQDYQPRPFTRIARPSDRKQAAEIARDLIKRYPTTIAGRNAEQLIKQLAQQTLTLELEEVTDHNKPFRARVTYQNVPTVFYRLYKLPPGVRRNYNNSIIHGDTTQQRADYRTLLTYPLVAQGKTALPDDADLQTHSVEMPIQGVPVGQYALLIANDEQFTEKTSQLSLAAFAVSQLGYLTRKNPDTNAQTLYVTDRQTGQPLANVQVAVGIELREGSTSIRKVGPVDKTDASGRIDIGRAQLPAEGQYWFRLTRGLDVLDTDRDYVYRSYRDNRPETVAKSTALFFTDRAIYRPGQTIYFKGLLYSGKDNDFKVVANEKTEVTLDDVNGEEVSKLTLTTNEFGTFTGTFVAPTGRLTGAMIIACALGETTIRVEEYKRPTFAVTVESVKKSVKLGQTVTVSAMAKTLAGAVVDGAQVRYRVTRNYYYRPYRDYWRKQSFPNSPRAEIASGEAITDDKGNVRITFPATADRSISASENPQFAFAITFDVTDRAGETRSATQTLRIGYTALQVELNLPTQIGQGDAKSYAVRVTNQSGEVVAVKQGEVVISRLQSPTRLLRSRLWERPDRQLLSREEFTRLFPNDLYENEEDPTTWPKQVLRTTGLRDIKVADLTPGTYYADVSITDSVGETARQRVLFTVVDTPPAPENTETNPSGQRINGRWLQAQKTVVQPGEKAAFLVGVTQTGIALPMWVLMSVEENHTLVRQEWLHITGKPQSVLLPVGEKQRGGFVVSFAMVQQGRFYSETQAISVPFTNKELTVETQTFRDKLKPGQLEEWTLKISGPAKDKVLAEMVATLYDASLDQFMTHNWPGDIYENYAGGYDGWRSGCFDVSQTQRLFYNYQPEPTLLQRHYDRLIDLLNGDSGLRISVMRVGNAIRGRVTDAKNQGIPGVTVALIGTLKGTATDRNGNFTLTVTTAEVSVRVRFSMIGYVTQEAEVGKTKRLLRMAEDNQMLNEAVVVGYAAAPRGGITGAVQGRAAGVKVGGGGAVQRKMAMDSRSKEEDGFAAVEELKEAVAAEEIRQGVDPNATQLLINTTIRKNFNETAFFFPQLQTDAQGAVVLKFTMPEALTRWHLMAFAHTKDMKTGALTRDAVTQKELMITANAPRFLREGDTLRLSARVNNLTDRPLTGSANLTLLDALTGETATKFGPTSPVALTIAPGLSTVVSWKLVVPTGGTEAVTLRLTAQAGNFTDGEERTIPVLPNRMLVTDTQPFWVNGSGATATFKLKPLTTLSPELPVQHERLTVEVTSNPAWYALQSLPYLMEYRYECAEQLFSRLYANSLAAHILSSRPVFRQVVNAWQQSAPKSPLQTNEELKAITLENTPWLADARSETERTAKLGQLFNQNQLAGEQQRTFDKLAQLQTESGGFRWFGGMDPDLTMTLHILGGFGHLQKLGVQSDQPARVSAMTEKAVQYVDGRMKRWMAEQQKLKTPDLSAYLPMQYLYARSFYTDKPVDKALLTYLTAAIAANWRKNSLQSQALAALALSRFGNKTVPATILKSVRERATLSDELGMFWPENQSGLFWYQSPVETQAYLIEAFDELANDKTAVDNAKRWLLRQKKTQSWSSTKATTEAIYALLLRGSDWLNTTPNTTVTVGGQSIESRVTKTDVATGYQKVVYAASEIKPELGVVQISKQAGGPAWGAAYWQHFEPLDQVKPSVQATGAGLSVQKTLFVQTNSPEGPVITPIIDKTRLKPGDLIKVRVILKTDRAMEYVHLKDGRASGFEPVAALSGYKYQNGLGYYEAPRDASTDFFISYLPVGTHIFEYELRVAQTGDFSAGVATVQCFYAPEFAAHSSGERVRVK